MIKGSVHQEDIMVLNVCTPNYKASKYRLSDRLKGGTEKFTIIVGNVNIPFPVTNKIDRNSVRTSKLE